MSEYYAGIESDLRVIFQGVPEHLVSQVAQDFIFVIGNLPKSLQPLRHYKLTLNGSTVDERWLVRKSHFDEAYPSAD